MTATPDPWSELRRHTPARIALGRAGSSLPTAEWLRLGVAHAQARDAVHLPFDSAAVVGALAAQGVTAVVVESAAGDRATYLRRPDLGRRLSPRSAALLADAGAAVAWTGTRCDLAVMVGDGLSALAVHAHAAPLIGALRPLLAPAGAGDEAATAVVLAHQARVALGDEVGALLEARAVLVLIGERPGLSSPDSLGAYLTWAPRVGRSDAERNCVSNIRPSGLAVEAAAARIAWLLGAARRLGATGVALKDESAPPPALTGEATPALPPARSDPSILSSPAEAGDAGQSGA